MTTKTGACCSVGQSSRRLCFRNHLVCCFVSYGSCVEFVIAVARDVRLLVFLCDLCLLPLLVPIPLMLFFFSLSDTILLLLRICIPLRAHLLRVNLRRLLLRALLVLKGSV